MSRHDERRRRRVELEALARREESLQKLLASLRADYEKRTHRA